MTYYALIREMQAAVAALGTFIALWGFVQFAPCLGHLLMGRYQGPHSHCVRYTIMALICLATMIFAFARMNALGYFDFDGGAAGTAFIAAMLIMVFTIGVSVWAKQRFQAIEKLQDWRTPDISLRPLARILSWLFIVTLAFLAVGIIHSSLYE